MDNTFLLCRGKRLDNGEWVTGYYVPMSDSRTTITLPYLMSDDNNGSIDALVVDPATVGRCTGFSAKKSRRGVPPEDLLVFEGDVVLYPSWPENIPKEAVVWWADAGWRIIDTREYVNNVDGYLGWLPTWSDLEIIGTIWDQAEAVKRYE